MCISQLEFPQCSVLSSSFPSCKGCLRWFLSYVVHLSLCGYSKENVVEREAVGMAPGVLLRMSPLILYCPFCHGAAYPLSRIKNTHTGIPAPENIRKKKSGPSRILPKPLQSLVSSGRLELVLSCECLRHLLDAIHGCLHLGSSESLHNCLGIIKMQTIPRLHNSTCKCVSR